MTSIPGNTSFPVDGDVILIKDDRLTDALTLLAPETPGYPSDVLVPGAGRPGDRREAELPRRTVTTAGSRPMSC